jgi:hypothetical protein
MNKSSPTLGRGRQLISSYIQAWIRRQKHQVWPKEEEELFMNKSTNTEKGKTKLAFSSNVQILYDHLSKREREREKTLTTFSHHKMWREKEALRRHKCTKQKFWESATTMPIIFWCQRYALGISKFNKHSYMFMSIDFLFNFSLNQNHTHKMWTFI